MFFSSVLDVSCNMDAMNRLDFLLSGILKNPPSASRNGIIQEIPIQSSSRVTFPERDSYPSTKLPPAIATTVPLPPRRDSSSMKHHRRRHKIDQSDQQKQYQPLLNSSTLDDLFRALTLECEQYLAAKPPHENKIKNQINVKPSSKIQTTAGSNDDDYENLHVSRPIKPTKTSISPLKTSIEVISPVKRHIVSITVSSKVSSPQIISPAKTISTSVITPTNRPSSEEDSINISPSNTNRKRRRRVRKQIISSSATRSSSSSTERKETPVEKKVPVSKRSCSTDPRCHHNKNSRDNSFISPLSTQKQLTKRPHRRDVSLQHSLPVSGRFRENHSSPLSVLLTSTKPTSDFLDNSHQRQQRRSRLESVDHKPSPLLNRIHQQFYRPSSSRNTNNNNNNKNIPTHQIPSYPVY